MTESVSFRILFVEDLPTDAELAERELKSGGISVDSMRVETETDFLSALESFSPDIVISDYFLPSFNGMKALSLTRANDPLLPFIILTGSTNEDTAVDCLKAGASDYVLKEHMTRLPFAVREAMDRHRIQTISADRAEMLKESEARYRSLFEDSHAVMLILDPKEGSIVQVNQAACDFYGWTREELLRMKIGQINVQGEDTLKRFMTHAAAPPKGRLECKQRLAGGQIRDIEIHSGPIVLGDRHLLFFIVHDISARIAAEAERDEVASRLAHYLATSPTVTYSLMIKEGKATLQWVSENTRTILGYAVEEALAPDWWISNVHPADRMRAMGGISKLTGLKALRQEYRFLKRDRSVLWLHDEMRFAPVDAGEVEVIGTLTDITDRKKVEADLSLKSAALEAAANAIVITDREGNIQWLNEAFERLSGYKRQEAIGKNPSSLVKSGIHDIGFYRDLWETILSGQVWHGEIVNKTKEGRLYTEEMTITPVLDETRRITSFVAIKNDVTAREESSRKLAISLGEKEALLRNLHHRNNEGIQLVLGLLSLSQAGVDESGLQVAMAGMQRRVLTLSQVYRQFDEAGDASRIDFARFLRRCADGLKGNHPDFGNEINIAPGGEAILLALDEAIPAGLAASELLSVSLARPEGAAQGDIEMTLRRNGGQVELAVKDLGDLRSSEGKEPFSLSLVRSLAQRLGGKMEISVSRGTEALLSFPEVHSIRGVEDAYRE